jgi:hypothetical protein
LSCQFKISGPLAFYHQSIMTRSSTIEGYIVILGVPAWSSTGTRFPHL